jgi:hypothetical protein
LAAIISVLCVANAKAVPITYTESATVSGTLTPVSGPVITFTDAQLTLTGTGDTANVIGGVFAPFFENAVTATFIVGGAGAGTFTNNIMVFSDQIAAAAGFFDRSLGRSGETILRTTDAAFATYALATSIGPITGSSLFPSGVSFATTAGGLIINSAGDATFTAVVTPAVPLPSGLPLFATALVGLVLLGWRRKRKA